MKNRETYLSQAITALRPKFKAIGAPLPTNLKVTTGFPSKSAGRASRQRVGEFWDASASADNMHNILISPVLDDPIQVLGVLVHELVHAAVGVEAGHGPNFKRRALAIGLEGKMTATTTGKELSAYLEILSIRLGAYPHGALRPNHKKQTARMIKVTCDDIVCGMVFRTSRRWIDEAPDGFNCPSCGSSTEIG